MLKSKTKNAGGKSLNLREAQASKRLGEMKEKFQKHKSSLKAGDTAPLFKGQDQFGDVIKLKDFIGKKVILFFYPMDDTPGCTTQSCNLRDHYNHLTKQGFVVLGISPDGEKSHAKFAKKFKLPFSLIADEKKEIIKAYDVWGKKKIFGITYKGLIRTTFIIDEAGKIEGVIDNVDTANHSAQVLTLSQPSAALGLTIGH